MEKIYRPHCISTTVQLLIIYLITTNNSTGQGITAILNDKAPHTLTEYNMDHLDT